MDLLQDLAVAARRLAKAPGFTATAALTLALGIGTTTAIFGVAHGVLLRPLPYRQPERIVTLWQHDLVSGNERDAVAVANFLDWQERSRSFERLALAEPYGLDLTGSGEPETLRGWLVSEAFFEVMGVPARLGRVFGPDDAAPGPPPPSC